MERRLVPELLDSLPPDHPDALHNRRDLRWINALMGNARWFERNLPSRVAPAETVLELGAGLGELANALSGQGVRTDALDRWPQPPCWPGGRAWHQTDLETFDQWARYPVVIGNLILHQFPDPTLRELGAHLDTHARLLLFCEPVRRRGSQHLLAAVAPLIGANHVSRHDGHVSIEAGFIANELPARLGLSPDRWRWEVRTTLFGAYRLVAQRRAPA